MRIVISLLLLFLTHILHAEPVVTQAHDLAADSTLAQVTQRPLLIMVSSTECSYCALLKREVIKPMIASGQYHDRIIIRELLIDLDDPVIDFDGQARSASAIAADYAERLTPTLLFLDPKGEPLVERIRGISNLDFYGFYLDRAIDQALRLLQNRS